MHTYSVTVKTWNTKEGYYDFMTFLIKAPDALTAMSRVSGEIVDFHLID